jgi:predicted nucleotide-binding protein
MSSLGIALIPIDRWARRCGGKEEEIQMSEHEFTVDGVERVLKGNNIPFTTKKIQHAVQFRLTDGGILAVFDTGKVVPQGKESPLRTKALEILSVAPPIEATAEVAPTNAGHAYSNRVFIVYGHDANAREQLELLLRRMRLEPVVLQNLPSAGQTIIEKLESTSDVTFACALLTPDDEGHVRDKPGDKRHRARQNVVLELGMFLSKLGRKRVAILHKGDLELPSDINGLLYIPFKDRVDEVKERLAAELQEAGFKINIKDLLS